MITHTMDRECQDLGKNKTQTWAKYIYIYIYNYIHIHMWRDGLGECN